MNNNTLSEQPKEAEKSQTPSGPSQFASMSKSERRYLIRGLDQPGGKLPLFDRLGQRIPKQTIEACLRKEWCEPWARNPIKPDWLVCKLTDKGRAALAVKES